MLVNVCLDTCIHGVVNCCVSNSKKSLAMRGHPNHRLYEIKLPLRTDGGRAWVSLNEWCVQRDIITIYSFVLEWEVTVGNVQDWERIKLWQRLFLSKCIFKLYVVYSSVFVSKCNHFCAVLQVGYFVSQVFNDHTRHRRNVEQRIDLYFVVLSEYFVFDWSSVLSAIADQLLTASTSWNCLKRHQLMTIQGY